MSGPPDRLKLLATSWSIVAEGYNAAFSSRFQPWQRDTIAQLAAALPRGGSGSASAGASSAAGAGGTIAVPACGPGQELPLLAAAFPQHLIVGIDLAEGMVEVAQRLVASRGLENRVQVRVGDASRLDDLAPLSAVVSVFGLQQMPDPAQVLANWTRSLSPGGCLCVCFWPQQVEARGPWQLLTQLTASFRPQPDWEGGIPGLALAEGAELVRDERVVHAVEWPSVDEFWESMVRRGPWHSRLLHFGEQHMEELRTKFMQAYPQQVHAEGARAAQSAPAAAEAAAGAAAGLSADAEELLRHAPAARLVCLRRRAAPAAAL